MTAYNITLIPGDGVGPEVTEAARRVLEATGVSFHWELGYAGDVAQDMYGTPLPDHVLESIKKNKMGLVTHANAQAGAASRGAKIRGNQVIGVFRPDFAIRMLKASAEAGFEAPIRVYIYDNENGTATIAYLKPSDVFAPYSNPDLDQMAKELDVIFARIVQDAIAASRRP